MNDKFYKQLLRLLAPPLLLLNSALYVEQRTSLETPTHFIEITSLCSAKSTIEVHGDDILSVVLDSQLHEISYKMLLKCYLRGGALLFQCSLTLFFVTRGGHVHWISISSSSVASGKYSMVYYIAIKMIVMIACTTNDRNSAKRYPHHSATIESFILQLESIVILCDFQFNRKRLNRQKCVKYI